MSELYGEENIYSGSAKGAVAEMMENMERMVKTRMPKVIMARTVGWKRRRGQTREGGGQKWNSEGLCRRKNSLDSFSFGSPSANWTLIIVKVASARTR